MFFRHVNCDGSFPVAVDNWNFCSWHAPLVVKRSNYVPIFSTGALQRDGFNLTGHQEEASVCLWRIGLLLSWDYIYLPSSSSWLLCSRFFTLVLLQCVYISVVSGLTNPDPRLWADADSFSSSSQASLLLLRVALLLDCFVRVFTSLSRTQRAANFHLS